MDGISSRKLTWGICIVGIAIAIISFFFLPEIIPVHFAGNGVADDFGNKTEIFLMPILLLARNYIDRRNFYDLCFVCLKADL